MTAKILKKISTALSRKQAKVLVSLVRNGRMRDSELKDIIECKSDNSAAYYRTNLERQGIIKGYTAVVDWKKLGYSLGFMVMVDGLSKNMFNRIERNHVFSTEEYRSKVGDIVITPVPYGKVVLERVLILDEKLACIMGYATSKDAAKSYCNIYLKERYPGINVKLYLLESFTVENFLISEDALRKYRKLSPMTTSDKRRLERFRREFLTRFTE